MGLFAEDLAMILGHATLPFVFYKTSNHICPAVSDTNLVNMSKLDLCEEPLDEAFALTAAFQNDTHLAKVSLGAGVYRDGMGQPWVLPSVAKVASQSHDIY